MLLRFISESWVDNLKIIIIVLCFVYVISWSIISRRFKKINDKNLNKLVDCISLISMLIMLISINFLLSSSWKQIPEYNKYHFFFYTIPSVIFGGMFYLGITTALIYKKSKRISYLIVGVLSSSLSAFGFGLSLFKVLQMFKIVI